MDVCFSQPESISLYTNPSPKRRWWGSAICGSLANCREFPELSKVGTALAFGVFLSASSAAAVAAAEAGAAGAEVGAVKSATRILDTHF